jgi:exodeoxyribonuclease-5
MIHFNPEQEAIIEGAVHHIHHSSKQVYQFCGGPGTGKTECIHEIVRRSGIPVDRIAPMAYIGQAAIVMRLRGLYNAKTIHSTLYEVITEYLKDENGEYVLDPVFNKPIVTHKFIPRNLDNIDLLIIDEGYTVPLSMKKDIESRGKKIIVCGDRNQLPPVKDEPAYLVGDDVHEIHQIMRQKQGSYIIQLSNMLLNGIEPPLGLHGNVLVIEEKDLTPEMIRNAQVVICGTNKTRDRYNDYIRHQIMGYHTTLPQIGERVMCRKNNWDISVDGINLTNGLTGTVVSPPDVYTYNKNKMFSIDFVSDLLGLRFNDLVCDYKYFTSNDRAEKEMIKSSRYMAGEAFEYAYAKTTHLCQGSQYYNGIYISEYMHPDIQRQLDFTAVTRFINCLIYVVKRRKKYYSF